MKFSVYPRNVAQAEWLESKEQELSLRLRERLEKHNIFGTIYSRDYEYGDGKIHYSSINLINRSGELIKRKVSGDIDYTLTFLTFEPEFPGIGPHDRDGYEDYYWTINHLKEIESDFNKIKENIRDIFEEEKKLEKIPNGFRFT